MSVAESTCLFDLGRQSEPYSWAPFICCCVASSYIHVFTTCTPGSPRPSLLPVILTSAQSGDDSCSSLNQYVVWNPNCYIYSFGAPCSGLYCYDDTTNTYVEIEVNECEDPVSVLVFYEHYDSTIRHYEEFQYLFNQSESVENDGIYSYYDYSGFGDVDAGTFTAIMERNASHLGFEV